jgi:hypothetical protein
VKPNRSAGRITLDERLLEVVTPGAQDTRSAIAQA